MIAKTMDFLLRTKLGWGVLALALVATGLLIWLGWWLGSPLFLNRTVDDAFPGTALLTTHYRTLLTTHSLALLTLQYPVIEPGKR